MIGGGGQNNMFAPQYFHGGGGLPLWPPRIDAPGQKEQLELKLFFVQNNGID